MTVIVFAPPVLFANSGRKKKEEKKKHWPDLSVYFSLSWDSVSNANNAKDSELFGTVGLSFCILNAFLFI